MQTKTRALIVAFLASLAVIAAGQVAARNSAGARVDYVATPAPQTRVFSPNAAYIACFVPDGPACETLLVDTIRAAQRTLLVQAYSFTSAPIAEALVQAHKRGVDVRVILDRSQVSERYTSATFLANAGIPVVIDTRPAIAHNKVMIFDGTAVFTGSFNFTRSAQQRNAENGLVIREPAVAKLYTDNWEARYRVSSPYR